MKKISLFNGHETPEALSNICFMRRCDAVELRVALGNCKNSAELLRTIKKMTALEWVIMLDTEDEIILKNTDKLGNKKYLRWSAS